MNFFSTSEYDARISSTYYQALKTKLADIEAGVRIVDEKGGSSQPAAGRLEVYQDGKWTEPRKGMKWNILQGDIMLEIFEANLSEFICKFRPLF